MFDGMSTMEVIKLAFPIIIIDVCLKIFCLFRLYKDRVKYLPKFAWALIILLVSTFGSLIFLIFGRVKD